MLLPALFLVLLLIVIAMQLGVIWVTYGDFRVRRKMLAYIERRDAEKKSSLTLSKSTIQAGVPA